MKYDPEENKKQSLCKGLGANKVYYGSGANGECCDVCLLILKQRWILSLG